MEKLQKGLQFLLDKYSVDADVTLKDEKTVVAGGRELPVLAHRNERRFIELKNIANGGTLVGISVMRVARIVAKGACLYAELYRELDICQFVLQRKFKSIMAIRNDNVMNVIATTEDGIVCTLEIAATLQAGEKEIDKHEIISQRGTACDVVVDAQLKQDSIYVFGAENTKYTDVDFELYGLTQEEVSVVRAAFTLAQKKNFDQIAEVDVNLKKLVSMAKEAVTSGKRQVL